MGSSTDDNAGADEDRRGVRRRLSSSKHRIETTERQSQHHSSTPLSAREVVPTVSSFEKKAVSGPFFIITEEVAWRRELGEANLSPFAEVERCWEEHRATGKMHHEPPWRVCAAAEDNREHPYFMRWLDTVELPPLQELLNKTVCSGSAPAEHGSGFEKQFVVQKDNQCSGRET
ncbi:hypothetical protein TraAM80_00109 [Trypanosoma rangeli]|uniref:Uncharacterized protein n=1 Tax=Trypanosoma rangeli TaxID=5698 RepID=A0A422P514_TRYRA|nr:uncharacterized protein TraAM80_00109 [Trypanosoma rangeli]RNF12754.1 hypothetical protein TraAM80_00109 [Trypanosoma rangeli]|eukprot:RNF12754.1 hypothetical protein TraAM80_00109 [Trypanosoma rangeli]